MTKNTCISILTLCIYISSFVAFSELSVLVVNFFLNSTKSAKTTIYRQYNTCNKTGSLRTQKLNCTVQFLDITKPAHGCVGNYLQTSVGERTIGVDKHFAVLLANKKAGRYGIYTNSVAVFHGHFHG